MGTKFFYTIKAQFDFFCNKVFLNDFLYDNMYRVFSFFWDFLCSYTFYLFGSLFRQIFRFQKGKSFDKYESNSNEDYDNRIGSSCSQNSGIIDKSNEENENSVFMETALSASTNRYEFLSGKGVCGFVEEPRIFSFTVHELILDSNNGAILNTPTIFDTGGSIDEDFQEVGLDGEAEEKTEKAGVFLKSFVIDEVLEEKQETLMEEMSSEEEFVSDDEVTGDQGFRNLELDAEKTEDSVKSLVIEEILEKPELVIEEILEKPEIGISMEEKSYDEEEMGGLEHSSEAIHDSSNEVQFLSKCQSCAYDAEKESICSNGEIDSTSHGISGNKAVGEVFDPKRLVSIDEEKAEQIREVEQVFIEEFGPEVCGLLNEEKAEHNREPEVVLTRYQSTDSDDEYIELQPQKQNSILLEEEIFSRENFEDKQEEQELNHEKAEPKLEEPIFREQDSSNSHVQSDTDYMFEHQDIIDQLKIELKLARTGGLPTILEESESEELETPKTVQELKPMKINEQKFEHKDFLDGIQKVYKSYLDKMRKLDILNFQTMHALGLLQMKDRDKFSTARKSSVPAIMSLLSQNLWSCKGIAVIDPIKKVIVDMHRDFETIYVGQVCLSWEVLHWQYWKVQELQTFNFQGSHQYNQVAGEFQLFQVLIQRFLENEQFQGPRVQNYVKNRCVLRSLLQVPLVKDDSLKNKDQEDNITSEILKESIEESMRVFWEFLRADKDESNVILHGHHQNHVNNLQDIVDLELLTDIRTDFQKKEKKLKDVLRSGNCIVKRFKKQQDDQVHGIHTLFIAQVELKLVSRVLNMSKLTTDQLIWCHEKLDKINFSNRKVFVESSFLLFPC